MASLSGALHKHCFISSNFIQNFRNVLKLKYTSFDISYKQMRKINSCVFPIQIKNCRFTSPFILENSHIFRNVFYLRHLSRWTRYSQTGYYTSQNSKKKYRIRNLQLAEKVRKFQRLKFRETKRRIVRTVGEIKENILTIPNGLCVLRIISTPVLGYLVLSEFYVASLAVFIFAGVTDLIDGYIARNFPNQQSMIGSFLDPAADKLLVSTLFITLTLNGLIPIPLTSLVISRDVCLMGAGFYIRYVSLPPPKTLNRYFDMSFATARLSPTAISKANTLIQLCLVAASLGAPVFNYVDHFYLQILWYITGSTTILSAASYLYFKNSTYKFFLFPKNNGKN